jgi:dipeptidyl aminopeptidase/acylaminoacyl peptidase
MPAAPYGSWRSQLSAAMAAEAGIRHSEPWLGADGSAWWLERRPKDEGRTTLVHDGHDVTPPTVNVRTRVHEYGGGAWFLHGDTAFFSNFDDQRLYRLDPGLDPRPITPEPPEPGSVRYADGRVSPDGQLIVCVRETHGDDEPANELVALPADGEGEARVLASGRDFYSFPRLSPDGATLAWTCWDHPNMPWDGTELWVAPLATPGEARLVAGGESESIWQPEWSPDGVLHFVSDRSGWWNLYREDAQLTDERAELGYPQWAFGGSSYAFLDGGDIACIRVEGGYERLCILRVGESDPEDLGLPYTAVGYPELRSVGDRVIYAAKSPAEEGVVVSWSAAEGVRVLSGPGEHALAPEWAPEPRAIKFASAGGRTAHAFWYPPKNPDYSAPPDERPPIIVQSHGGPTAHAIPEFDSEIAFWTSRGIGVVDVNYGGSTGFGREYRELLNGAWGIVDVEDCIAAALHLARQGEADGKRVAVHGGSAGGYTTLCGLAFHEDFAAGASYYGVADAETLAADTHKFESRYLDSLIGPYPETAERYRERSPIHFADRIRAPVILFQGLEDEVVPPSQAETMVAALKENGVPHAYLAFEGEQHGFRKSETVISCLEAELSFYAQVFGFEPADDVEPVEIVR